MPELAQAVLKDQKGHPQLAQEIDHRPTAIAVPTAGVGRVEAIQNAPVRATYRQSARLPAEAALLQVAQEPQTCGEEDRWQDDRGRASYATAAGGVLALILIAYFQS